MLPFLCLLAIASQVSADGFGFGSQMSKNGFKFGFPGFGSWPSNTAVVGNVRERFDQMLQRFGKEKPGLKTKIRKENDGSRKVTTVTQDGKGYHSFTRYSTDNPNEYSKTTKWKGKNHVSKGKHLKVREEFRGNYMLFGRGGNSNKLQSPGAVYNCYGL